MAAVSVFPLLTFAPAEVHSLSTFWCDFRQFGVKLRRGVVVFLISVDKHRLVSVYGLNLTVIRRAQKTGSRFELVDEQELLIEVSYNLYNVLYLLLLDVTFAK